MDIILNDYILPKIRANFFLIFLLLFTVMYAYSQKAIPPDYAGYVARFKELAVTEMKIYHIPASIILAQGIIESNCGKSPLATEANNHFGIKCHKDWQGETYLFDDDKEQECFRKYSCAEESFRDHSLFLINKPRYAALFSLDINDYTGWAMGLKQAGYATNPDYPKLLINMIESNKLFLFDDTTLTTDILDKKPEASKIILQEDDQLNYGPVIRLFDKNYKMPDPKDFHQIKESKLGRKVYENNSIPFIFVKKGDTWYSIASEFGINSFQVYHDNDMKENDVLSIGQIIYLEPKKRKSHISTHVFQNSETLFSVSQLYGVKMKFIMKYNHLDQGDIPKAGDVIHLSR